MKANQKRGQATLKGDGRDYSRLVLAAFDSIQDDAERDRIIDLNHRRREVNENAKKRF
ncbi:hypothetical protein [Pseudomonas sp. zfem002]|uniref:hypothetical protein n=1 Tax=Pseudomonas sp. zfem002 TaxID=3078197 RepID=UPI0029290A4C|nr:hypothetical protein [Pseudomonas sp. zfem002]MDU9394568.1 hypothetical protein [Pseudomonas sp. zfem002]